MQKAKLKRVRIDPWNMSGAERLAIWRRAQAVWSKRRVDPIKELNKIRREWR